MENNASKPNFLMKLKYFFVSIKNFIVKCWNKFRDYYRRHDTMQLYTLMLPFLILFFIFTILPVGMSLFYSFTNFNMLEKPDFIFLDNYKRLFLEDPVFLTALKNTLVLAVITGPVSYILAFVIAWLINELPNKLRVFFTLIFYAPSLSGNAFLIWTLIFSGDSYGYANAILRYLGVITSPIQWLQDTDYILWILVIVQLWLSLGVGFLSFVAGLKGVDKTLYEAGAIDGIRNRWQELWYITLPQMKPQLLFGAVTQITSAFSVAAVSIELCGLPSVDYAGHTIITHLKDYGGVKYEMGYASAIATVLFVIMILSNQLIQKFIKRVGK